MLNAARKILDKAGLRVVISILRHPELLSLSAGKSRAISDEEGRGTSCLSIHSLRLPTPNTSISLSEKAHRRELNSFACVILLIHN